MGECLTDFDPSHNNPTNIGMKIIPAGEWKGDYLVDLSLHNLVDHN
jgi:hypothetical protein